MKIKEVYVTCDAYIGGTFVRDDGEELGFMLEQGAWRIDRTASDDGITREEEDAIVDVVREHVGCKLVSFFESINMELMDAEFELEV